MKIDIYTDGACKGNQFKYANGGWAAVILENGWDKPLKIISGCAKDTTNNRMELMACIIGLDYTLKNLKDLKNLKNIDSITIFSDSAYIVNCFKQKWHINWVKNGWKNAKRQPIKNKDLWLKLLKIYNDNPIIKFIHVKGHAGNKFNEMADKRAVKEIEDCFN